MSESRNIAFLCHPYHRGGVTRWMADAAIHYAAKGWKVYFVTVTPDSPFISSGGRETMVSLVNTHAGVTIITSRAGSEFELGTPEYRVYIYRQLLRTLPAGVPLILSDDASVWQAATYFHKVYGVIGVLHADDPHYYELAERYYNQVSALVCVSERVRRLVSARIPRFPAEKLYTIPCGIDLPQQNINVPDGGILQLAYVGRITEFQKRVSDFIPLCAALRERKVNFHLNMIGEGGDERMRLEQEFKQLGLLSFVTFHGWQSKARVNEMLCTADILVLTSNFEGTPIAMMEALAAGCGVVGTRVSGIEDYEQHPQAADCYRVFDVADIAAAADNIMSLAKVPVAIRRASARRLAESEFAMEVCVERYSRVVAGIGESVDAMPEVFLGFPAVIYSRMLAFARKFKLLLRGYGNEK